SPCLSVSAMGFPSDVGYSTSPAGLGRVVTAMGLLARDCSSSVAIIASAPGCRQTMVICARLLAMKPELRRETPRMSRCARPVLFEAADSRPRRLPRSPNFAYRQSLPTIEEKDPHGRRHSHRGAG